MPVAQDKVAGLLTSARKGAYVLRSAAAATPDLFVPARLVEQHGLVVGARVAGRVQAGQRGPELATVETVCDLTPAAFQRRSPFSQLVAVDPSDRFPFDRSDDASARILDLVAPIGRGTRGLIVAPPKAGKTILLERIARAIWTTAPETRIVVMLVDERPEEVTYFRRTVHAEVFASSSDQKLQEHVALGELMLAHVRVELECGRHVVVLVDSFTRLVRAFNLKGTGAGRTLSGGLDAGAAELPRRLFGLARNVDHGGSVTILASILVDTGSRMDQVIFEEFKGTGNSEVVLDRALAEARLFPAVDIARSGTRKDERLHDAEDYRRIVKLRRMLLGYKPREALTLMLKLMDRYPTNADLLKNVPI